MQPSHTIARLIGPVFCVIGIGMLANAAVYREMAAQFLAGYPFIYLSGILALVAGLAILNAHHVWTRDWRSVITLLGWLMTFAGTFRIFAPQFVNYIGTSVLDPQRLFHRRRHRRCWRSAASSPSKATRRKPLKFNGDKTMNKPITSADLVTPKVTTGPLPASRKVYCSPASAPELRVPLREIMLERSRRRSRRCRSTTPPAPTPIRT